MSLALVICHLLPTSLEPEVLQGLSRIPIETCGSAVVTAPGSEISARDPCRRAVTAAAQLVEAALCGAELRLGLVESLLLEQRASEDEAATADLVDEVLAVAEELERLPDLLLGELRVAGAQVHLR